MPKTADRWLALMARAEIEKARGFHQSMPMYEPTPLISLGALSKRLGLGSIHVKDESFRFGLNAFKVLGASYAMARHIAQALSMDALEYQTLISEDTQKKLGDVTFFTATDGNHGRGVAWAARRLSQKAAVFMPKGSSDVRLQNIRNEGAIATIENGNYDDCVRLARRAAEKTPGGIVVQDTAWEGYEQIPIWVMQGYGTMALEAAERMGKRPTHIFIQAGVGSLAGAVIGCFENLYPENPPVFAVVEPTAADCVYQSAKAGMIRAVTGNMPTIMAGLACGEPNPIAFDILQNHADCFVSCPDWVAALGMRVLTAPLPGDARVISGESGAAGLGLLAAIMENENLSPLREALRLDKNAAVLLFSTEGDTDPACYRRICWGGAYPSPASA